MEIKRAVFTASMAEYRPPKLLLPQVALAGRSNVGKSSLINCLCHSGKLARVGAAPGKTRLLNFFLADERFYLVDLPGYGYAAAGKQEIRRWGDMMSAYFDQAGELSCVLHIVDIRHDPTRDDVTMNGFLRGKGIPFLVVASKCDKVSRGSRMKYLSPILRTLQVQPWQTVCFSAETGEGREELLRRLEEFLPAIPDAGTEE